MCALADSRQRHGAVIVGPGAKLRTPLTAYAGAVINMRCWHFEPRINRRGTRFCACVPAADTLR